MDPPTDLPIVPRSHCAKLKIFDGFPTTDSFAGRLKLRKQDTKSYENEKFENENS